MPARTAIYRIVKYSAVGYLLIYLATCEVLPLPTHSYCSQERSLIDSREVILRVIGRDGMSTRQTYFPDIPYKNPEEIYAANPNGWRATRTLFFWGNGAAWEITASERVDNVKRPGSWEGIFFTNLCATGIEASKMVTYDDELP